MILAKKSTEMGYFYGTFGDWVSKSMEHLEIGSCFYGTFGDWVQKPSKNWPKTCEFMEHLEIGLSLISICSIGGELKNREKIDAKNLQKRVLLY